MVKPDFSRDYYADLELPTTADADAVKKQFRKLGRKTTLRLLERALWLIMSQHSSTIQIAIPVASLKSTPSFR
jgi:hypothetical protein